MNLLFRCASGLVATFLTLQFIACASDETTSASPAAASSTTATDNGVSSSTSATGVKTTSVEVGPDGKTFETESGMTVTIPPGALPAGTTITVKSGEESAPTGFQSETGVFRFGPDGLVFATPITVSLPSTSTSGSVYWSRQEDPSMYDALPTTFENGHAIAHPIHFSSAFVGKAADPVSTPDTNDDAGATPTDPGGGTTPPTKDDAGATPTDPDGGTTPPTKDDAGATPTDPGGGTTVPTKDAGATEPPPAQPLRCNVADRVTSKECPEKGCVCQLAKTDQPELTAQLIRWFGDPQGAIYVSSDRLNQLYQTSASGGTFVATDDTHTRYAAPKQYKGYILRNGDTVELHEDYMLAAKDLDGCNGLPQMVLSCSGTGALQPNREK